MGEAAADTFTSEMNKVQLLTAAFTKTILLAFYMHCKTNTVLSQAILISLVKVQILFSYKICFFFAFA